MKNPEYRMQELDGEALLLNRQNRKVVSLNPTARLIWEMCDGKRDSEAISRILRENYPQSAGQILDGVCRTIDDLVKHKVLLIP